MLPHMALGGIGRMAIFRSSSRLGYHSLYLFVAASADSQDMGVRLLHLPTCEAKLWTPKMDGFSIEPDPALYAKPLGSQIGQSK